jgi:NADP-dependent 3-hydroxy acid dehydrogenase YdfG
VRRFENKCAVVTGASSGVGRAVALALAREGATVAFVGRDESKLRAVARESGTEKQYVFTAEFCDDNSLALLGKALERTFSSLDVLIHSAGMIKLGPLASAKLDDLDTHFRCNVRAPVALTQNLLPSVIAAQGSIVFLNSTVIDNPRAAVGQYAASKSALKAIADCLRDEVNARGVRVLSLFLGRTATPMQEAVHHSEDRTYNPSRLIQPEDVAALLLNALALPHTVELTNVHIRPSLPLA